MKRHGSLVKLAMAIAVVLLWLPAAARADNVALGKSVTLVGTFHGDSAAPATLVDGMFRARSTYWESGTVHWNGSAPYILIDLGGVFTVTSMVVQADDNDAYRVSFWDLNLQAWQTAWNVPNYDAYGWGMQTRPNPANDAEQWPLASPITTNQLKFAATSGDNSYSVSEIQAYGAPIPVPATVLLLGAGLIGLTGFSRRKLKSAAEAA